MLDGDGVAEGLGDALDGGGVADDGGGVAVGLVVLEGDVLEPVPSELSGVVVVLPVGVLDPDVPFGDTPVDPLAPASPTLLPGIVLLLPLCAPLWESGCCVPVCDPLCAPVCVAEPAPIDPVLPLPAVWANANVPSERVAIKRSFRILLGFSMAVYHGGLPFLVAF